jgi:hypothetical protein
MNNDTDSGLDAKKHTMSENKHTPPGWSAGENNLVPTDEIATIDNWGFCEDGKTYALTCTTADGQMLMIQATPGRPLSVALIVSR